MGDGLRWHVTVALDWTWTDDLRAKGWSGRSSTTCRPCASAAGLDLTDRIDLRIEVDPEARLFYAVGTDTSVIAAESLADWVQVAPLGEESVDDWEADADASVDGVSVHLFLRRADPGEEPRPEREG